MLEKLAIHELCACISFDKKDCFYYVIMGKEAKSWGLLLDAPDHYTLIIGATYECLPVFGYCQAPHPALMTCEGALAVASGDLPESNRLIPGRRKDKVAFRVEADVGDVVVVSVEGLKAEVVVVDVPEFDGEIG